MLTRIRISGGSPARIAQAAFTALTPVPGILHVEFQGAWTIVEHDGRATAAALREAIGVAGLEVAELVEERRSLPTL